MDSLWTWFLGRSKVFTLIYGGFFAENPKNHFFALYGRSKNRSKKARFWPSRSSKLNGWGGCVLCFQVAVHRGLMSIFWWIYRFGKKRLQVFFCIFSPVSMCDRTMVPSTTLESFKSGAFVVPDSTGGDLQTHTKTTMSRRFGCLVEMDEKCDFCNTCLYGTQCEWVMSQCGHCKKYSTPRFFNIAVRSYWLYV